MKKLFLPIISVFCLVIGLNAQSTVLQSAQVKPKKAMVLSATADTDPFQKLRYSNDITNAVGVTNTEVSAAVYFTTAKVTPYIGKKIYGIRLGLNAPATGLSIFLRSTLTGEDLYTQEVGDVPANWNSIVLTTPFEITGEFYLGYTSTSSGLQIGFTAGLSGTNASWLKIANNEWENYASSGFGALCIEAVMPVDEIPEAEMQVTGILPTYTKTNEPYKILAVTRNNTFTPVSSYDISYKIGENAVRSEKITKTLGWCEQDTLEITNADVLTERGTYNVSLSIDKVNDIDDIYTANNTGAGFVKAMDFMYPKKVVVEEGTGAWCGFCPKGIVGMELMSEKYDDFIGIAVHYNDGMVTSSYSKIISDVFNRTGYPGCIVNRKSELIGDPYEDIEYMFLHERAIPVEIGVNLTAEYASTEQKAVNVQATSTFGFTASNANTNYRLAYVLIEHGVTGTGSGFTQENYYAGGGRGTMHGFENLPAKIVGQVFNDVARNIYQYIGILNSIPANVTVNEPVTHEYSITLPTTVNDKSKLEIAVLLLDITTGQIVNAEITDISSPPTGLENSPSLNTLEVYVNNNLLYINSENIAVNNIDIYNSSGQLILSASNVTSPLSMANLKSGMYLVNVQTPEGSKVVKVIL